MGSATVPWKQLLLSAMESNSRLKHTSFFQLATIGSNGRPSNRTVVFRGFQENTDKIQINTDCRSRKIEEINHSPFAEICWYFTDSWEQFRINGRIDVIDGSNSDPLKLQEREKAWFASSPRSRLQYLGPVPGIPSLSEESSQELSLDPSAGPVAAFCLLILDPNQVDYLNLKSNQRLTFTSRMSVSEGKSWTMEKVTGLTMRMGRHFLFFFGVLELHFWTFSPMVTKRLASISLGTFPGLRLLRPSMTVWTARLSLKLGSLAGNDRAFGEAPE